MKCLSHALLCAAVALTVSGSPASPTDRGVSLSAQIQTVPTQDGRRIVWSDEDLLLHLELSYMQFPRDADSPATPAHDLNLHSDQWWRRLQLNLQRNNEPATVLDQTELQSLADIPRRSDKPLPSSKSLAIGHSITADLKLPATHPGTYTITVTSPDTGEWHTLAASVEVPTPVHFIVSDGSGDNQIQYLRQRELLSRDQSYEAKKAILFKLVELAPDEPRWYETLGDLSINGGAALAETVRYYDNVIRILAENRTAAEKKGVPPDVLVGIHAHISQLQSVKALVSRFRTNDHDLRLDIETFHAHGQPEPQKTYVLRDRWTGRVLDRADLPVTPGARATKSKHGLNLDRVFTSNATKRL